MFESLENAPENTLAVIDGARQFTYGDIHRRSLALASHLAARGIKPGDRVALLAHNREEYLTTTYACAALGAVLMPLNHRLTAPEQAAVLAQGAPTALIAELSFRTKVQAMQKEPEGRSVPSTQVWMDTVGEQSFEHAAASQASLSPHQAKDEELAQLYFTSGTTGTPKGVMLSHGNLRAHARMTAGELQLSADDVWGHIAPMFHLADAWATIAITAVGGRHVMQTQFTPDGTLRLIEDHEITASNLIPTMLNLMVKHPAKGDYKYTSLRIILSGGAPIATEVVRSIIEVFGCEYIQTYGMTETSPFLTMSILKPHLRALPANEQLTWRAKTGRPVQGISLRVVNEQGKNVPKDGVTPGEIIVRGPTVTKGYWNAPEASAEAIRSGWLHTGDLAVIDHEGYVNIVDRKKDVILTGGENVYSIEVENILYTHPAILEAAVFGLPDPTWGEQVTAALVLRPGTEASADELQAHCRTSLAGYKVPRAFRFLDALPRTGSGKIAKRHLR